MATQIKLRRDTAANWALEDPVLASGEPGYDTTNNVLKIGDGSSTWTGLASIYDPSTDIVPAADNTYDLGSPTNQWRHVYTAGTISVDGLTLTTGGQFNICTIVTGGSGYNTGSALKATTGGSGTGMTVGIGYGLSNQLSNVDVVDPGTGYVDGDVITVSEGTGGTFVLTRYNNQANQGNNNFVQSDWAFDPDGSLTLPPAGKIINNNNEWTFGTDGTTTFPTLTVPISDNATPSGTGQTIKFSDSTQQAIIYGPESTAGATSAERIIIQGAPGYAGTNGEGGDVYVWAGPGGSTNGQGGDIKVRAGQGIGTGTGGYLNFQAGDSATGAGGYINIESGQSDTHGLGGDITVRAQDGGEITLRTESSTGTISWLFDADGVLTLPAGGTIAEGGGISGAIRLTPAGGANAYQALLIYPTGAIDGGDHIHLTAGGGTTELYLGSDFHYVKLVDGGNIEVRATHPDTSTAAWTFDTDGNIDARQALGIKVPDGVPSSITDIGMTSGYWELNPLSNLATTGGSGSGLTVTVTETDGYASAIAIATAGTGYTAGDVITVTSGTASAAFIIAVAGRNTWLFGEDGDLYLPPGNTIRKIGSGEDIRSIPGPYADDAAAATAGVAVNYPYHKTGTGGQVFVRLT